MSKKYDFIDWRQLEKGYAHLFLGHGHCQLNIYYVNYSLLLISKCINFASPSPVERGCGADKERGLERLSRRTDEANERKRKGSEIQGRRSDGLATSRIVMETWLHATKSYQIAESVR
ncbi:hypothetical protein DINM_004911 [Dirofilaria immitis]|nr:hypothetical protein [Dirofilaria immitis]